MNVTLYRETEAMNLTFSLLVLQQLHTVGAQYELECRRELFNQSLNEACPWPLAPVQAGIPLSADVTMVTVGP